MTIRNDEVRHKQMDNITIHLQHLKNTVKSSQQLKNNNKAS